MFRKKKHFEGFSKIKKDHKQYNHIQIILQIPLNFMQTGIFSNVYANNLFVIQILVISKQIKEINEDGIC